MKIKSRIWFYPLIVIGLVSVLNNSCSDKEKDKNNIDPSAITDKDGNVYTSVTIGTQVWMVENLKTTKFNDNTNIPLVSDNAQWAALSTPAYCWYNNYAPNKNNYGALYNWYSVNTGKLCPTGWHVPTDAEWTILTTFLGDESVAGGKLKETGTSKWYEPNTGATNETGFTAVPCGSRSSDGSFESADQIRFDCYWWTPTTDVDYMAIVRYVDYFDSFVYPWEIYKESGMSVRCLKDN
jgi:uncharacterized protein (TIGR02145 family)